MSVNDGSIKLSSVSLLGVFRAVPLPPALTLPLPLNSTPPPANIHGNRYPGFPTLFYTVPHVTRTMVTEVVRDVVSHHSNRCQEALDSRQQLAEFEMESSERLGSLVVVRLIITEDVYSTQTV